jgi:pyruvate dehydrogenase (quinone)
MAHTVADFVLERLHVWGVRRIFGYPADGINGDPGRVGALGHAGEPLPGGGA